MSIADHLRDRADHACELCHATDTLAAWPVPHAPTDDETGHVLLCARCRSAAEQSDTLPGADWFCLQDAAWSHVEPVQVLAWRLLHRIGDAWATDLRDQVWLDDTVRTWAEAGLEVEDAVVVTDCNGAPLSEGDSVTLIKDLAVKGAGFTAKRGTMVRRIHLIDDSTHIEGRVEAQTIYLKTEFLKRAT